MLFSEELIINVKKSELQPTYSGLVKFCHIARRWLSTGIILNQTETDHKQRAFPHRYAYSMLPKVYSFYTALAFDWDWLRITGLTDWLIAQTSNAWPVLSCCPENYRRSLKSQGFCQGIQLCWSVELTQNTPEGAWRDFYNGINDNTNIVIIRSTSFISHFVAARINLGSLQLVSIQVAGNKICVISLKALKSLVSNIYLHAYMHDDRS